MAPQMWQHATSSVDLFVGLSLFIFFRMTSVSGEVLDVTTSRIFSERIAMSCVSTISKFVFHLFVSFSIFYLVPTLPEAEQRSCSVLSVPM